VQVLVLMHCRYSPRFNSLKCGLLHERNNAACLKSTARSNQIPQLRNLGMTLP
jgi:hypothetical protein